MFTRKGNLEDAIQSPNLNIKRGNSEHTWRPCIKEPQAALSRCKDCFEAGAAAVLKKAMPPALEGDAAAKIVQLDQAMMDDADHLKNHFVDNIKRGTFWYRYQSWVMLLIGALASAAFNTLWKIF